MQKPSYNPPKNIYSLYYFIVTIILEIALK